MRVARKQGRVTLALAGYLDLQTAPLLRAGLAPLLSDPALVELDVDGRELTFCDASGLSPLLKALLELRNRGGTIRLHNAQPGVRRLLETLHLDRDFEA